MTDRSEDGDGPAGRPRPRDRADLAARLLDSAERQVAAEGLTALTARRLAADVGCAVGSIYNVYDDLDDLVIQLNTRTLTRLQVALAPLAAADGSAETRLLALAEAYVAFTQANPHLWNALFEHRWRAETGAPEAMRAAIDRLFRLVEGTLAPLFGPGEAERQHRSARVLWLAVHGISSLAVSGRLAVVGAADASALARDLVRTYLAGLAGTPRPTGGTRDEA